MLLHRIGLTYPKLLDEMGYANALAFDWWTDGQLNRGAAPDAIVGISGSSLRTGRALQARGSHFICDRGSSHQRVQEALVSDEFRRWGVDRSVSDLRDTEREEEIYDMADAITVPSSFAARSFYASGIADEKVHVIPYGVRLEHFRPTGTPPANRFQVLFVGSVGLRKGIPYLLKAFADLKHSSRVLRIAGSIQPEMRHVLGRLPQQHVEFLGVVSQERLVNLMSTSHVMVLPSIEEGLALVQGQAMACGCPVLASTNTGAEDLFTDGVEGFIVPVRNTEVIRDKLQRLVDDPQLRQNLSEAALIRVRSLGGWNDYGDIWEKLLLKLTGAPTHKLDELDLVPFRNQDLRPSSSRHNRAIVLDGDTILPES